MRSGLIIAALILGLLAVGMPGAVLAEDGRTDWGNLGGADPEGAFIEAWQAQGPVEAAALPKASGSMGERSQIVSGDKAFTFVEIGGVLYRHSLDLGA